MIKNNFHLRKSEVQSRIKQDQKDIAEFTEYYKKHSLDADQRIAIKYREIIAGLNNEIKVLNAELGQY